MEGAYNLRGRVDVVVALSKNIKNKFYLSLTLDILLLKMKRLS